MAPVTVEVTSWVTRYVGGDGSGQRIVEASSTGRPTVRSVLREVSTRYPELQRALWHDGELGEHIEVLVNDAVLGVTHELDSPVTPGDRITLLPQFTGGGGPAPRTR
jgi:molybdopterin converting factor small subunit